jgi:hypothetical protein
VDRCRGRGDAERKSACDAEHREVHSKCAKVLSPPLLVFLCTPLSRAWCGT